VTPEDLAAYREELGIRDGDFPIIVAGSTHPSEEEAVLQAFTELRKSYPRAKLIIAPRKRPVPMRFGVWTPSTVMRQGSVLS
jgi:3-deoxy-D-manno-octulosonic-acid transferase